MRVVAVMGSPRPRSSSIAVAKHFLQLLSDGGADVQSFVLENLKFRGCAGCYGCKRNSEKCVISDDLTPVLDAVANSDLFVMATPVYILDVPGSLKCFIDRTFSYMPPDFYMEGGKRTRWTSSKKMFTIITQAQVVKFEVAARYEAYYGSIGFTCKNLHLLGVGLKEDIIQSRPEVGEQLVTIAKEYLGK